MVRTARVVWSLLAALRFLGPAEARADGAPYRVRVVDERGRPVAGALVELRTVPPSRIRMRTDARGRATAPVDAGAVQVLVRTDDGRTGASPMGYAEGCAESDCWVPGFDRPTVVTVVRPAKVEGHVRDREGRAAAGARVLLGWIGNGTGSLLDTIFQDERDSFASSLRRFRFPPDRAAGYHEAVRAAPVATTDASGAFAIEAEHPGVYALIVDAPGLASQVAAPVQLLAGRTTTTNITLTRGFRLDVVVQDAAGRPLSQVAVNIGNGCESAWLQTSADGTASFPGLVTGRYRVWADTVGSVAIASAGEDVRVVLGGPRPTASSAVPPIQCGLGPRPPAPEGPPVRDDIRLCDLGIDLYPIDGRMVATPYDLVRPVGSPAILEGDIVERVDGRPAPRTFVGRCGQPVRIDVTRPATGEHLHVTSRLTRSAESGE